MRRRARLCLEDDDTGYFPRLSFRLSSKTQGVTQVAEIAVVSNSRSGISWLSAIYLIVGGTVAATHHYWTALQTFKAVLSALLATFLWPLLLLGVNLHIH
jgi:hypothetical protein